MPYLPCELCGRVRYKKPGKIRKCKYVFCSHKCNAIHRFEVQGIRIPKRKPSKKIPMKCPICKKVKMLTPYERKEKKTDYCADCWETHMVSKRLWVFCSTCDKDFQKQRNKVLRDKNAKFYCSKECMRKARGNSVIIKCSTCKKPKKVPKSRLKTRKHFFCNNGCFLVYRETHLRKYATVRIRRSAALMGCDHKDIEKYNLTDILEIHALNLELKNLIKEANKWKQSKSKTTQTYEKPSSNRSTPSVKESPALVNPTRSQTS